MKVYNLWLFWGTTIIALKGGAASHSSTVVYSFNLSITIVIFIVYQLLEVHDYARALSTRRRSTVDAVTSPKLITTTSATSVILLLKWLY